MAQAQAKKENNGKSLRLTLLKKLTLAPEARTEPSKGKYPAGRIKKFIDIFRSNLPYFIMTNGLILIFALPLLAVLATFLLVGFENITYSLEKMVRPFLMSGFGIGLSSGISVLELKESMIFTYRVLVFGITAALPFLSFGIAGGVHIASKFVWGESFICKKDKMGREIPRIILEFFRGIKLYWKQMLVVISAFAIIFAGTANIILSFVSGIFAGNAGALHYIGLVFASVVLLFSTLIMVNLIPSVATYKMPLIHKVKNASILSFVFIIPNLFIIIIAVAPFLLILLNQIFAAVLVIAVIMVGFSFDILLFTNYADHNSENVQVPLYEMSVEGANKNKKSKKKSSKK